MPDATIIQFPSQPVICLDEHDGPDGYATAVFDLSRRYRYMLTRRWSTGEPLVFVMLNPSTADAFCLDATVRRCRDFAKREGYGAVMVLNLFAWRTRHPSAMKTALDPVGPLNDVTLDVMTKDRTVVCAWGTHGAFIHRGETVARRLAVLNRQLMCLHQTKDGFPGHPLYLRSDSPLVPFEVQ